MARQASVRPKNGYWYSEAGGIPRYFGDTESVTKTQATAALWRALAEGTKETQPQSPPTKILEPREAAAQTSITVTALTDSFLEWIERHRSVKTHLERSRHLARFRVACGEKIATGVKGSDLEAFRDGLKADRHAPDYVKKHEISVGAMFNWGVKHGLLPPGFRPFATFEPTRVPLRPLLESDLPTGAELQSLLTHADPELRDILTVYHATGARTHELIEARAGDFQRNARTLVLGRHKRSKTLRDPVPRTIHLNEESFAILARRSEGRQADAVLFPRPSDGGRHTSNSIDERFQNLRNRTGVRAQITIYSFRHLWISEALMAGLDVLLVARMAGTSIKMLETTYGHFRVRSFRDAQQVLDSSRARDR